jgi:hypothetical protein
MKKSKVIKLKPWRIFWYDIGRFFLWPGCMAHPWADLYTEYQLMSESEQVTVVVDYLVYGTDLATAIKKLRKHGPHGPHGPHSI